MFQFIKKQFGKKDIQEKSLLTSLQKIPRFIKLIWQTHRIYALTTIILRFVKALIPLLMLYTGKLIVDEVIALTSLQSPDSSYTFFLISLEALLALLNELLNRVIAFADAMLGDLLANKTSILLMEHASKLDLEQFENADFYDKLEKARRQTMNRTLLMSQLFAQIQELITLLSLTGALVIFNPWLILILIIGVIPSFIGETKFNSRSYALVTNFTPERRELDYLRLTASSDETAKEIKLSGISSFLIKRFKDLSEKYFNENKVLAIQKATWGTLLSIAGTIGYYGAYGWIALSAISGLISIGSLTFLAGSFARMRQIMEGILKRFADIAQGALYLEDYYSFFEIQPRIQDGNTWTPFPKPIKFGITLENVSFKYRGSEHFVLRNINLHIKPGERIAFVGENGSGKTTLVKLISRLYEPTEGQILLDGIPLNTYNPKELHENIGVIFQDYVRYQFTAGLNIAAGDIAFYDDFSRIKASAKNSLADQVIENLPEQYNQMIGRRFKNGIDLSGGQWQKIALGRVYMKDAQIVILDEPTASLDANAEHEVFERFSELSKGKIAFIISHRFSTVRMADRIAVIKNGEIIELGTHKQLIENQSLYYSLFTLQAKGYAD